MSAWVVKCSRVVTVPLNHRVRCDTWSEEHGNERFVGCGAECVALQLAAERLGVSVVADIVCDGHLTDDLGQPLDALGAPL